MKATLRFDLDDPNDAQTHMRCIKSLHAYGALSDILELLRNKREYEVPPSIDDLCTDIYRIIEDSGIDLSSEYS